MESLPYEKEAYVQSINLFLAVDTPIVADVSSYKGNFKKNVQHTTTAMLQYPLEHGCSSVQWIDINKKMHNYTYLQGHPSPISQSVPLVPVRADTACGARLCPLEQSLPASTHCQSG